ncbi:MAG: YqhA family protein [Planctomycetota bacterium]
MAQTPNDDSITKAASKAAEKVATKTAETAESVLENFLWRSRFMVLLAVIGSLLAGVAMFVVSSIDVWHLFSEVGHYFNATEGENVTSIRHHIVAVVVEIIDGYLLATVLLIFALGLYELFISRLDPAIEDEMSAKVLIINSLDDLKTRLAKVILMILIVNFFQFAIQLEVTTPLDLLAFGGGIALIGLALYLTHAKSHD